MSALPLPSLDAVQAQLARRKLSWFFRKSWHVLERDTLVWNWHLDAICDHVQALLEGRIPTRNLVINVPPGSSKSRIVSVCANAWWWIEHPEWRGIFTSANPRNVMRDAVYCRTLIESTWYQQTFKPQWGFARDQNAKGLYRTTEGGFRQSMGAGAGVTGDRAHGLFMDDMLDAAEGESRAARDAFTVWYDQAFANRVSNMTTSTRCMIAQRLHEGDPVGHVLKSGDWSILKIRQEFELEKAAVAGGAPEPAKPTPIGWSDPRTEIGSLMDPVRFPKAELAKERQRLGSRGYAAQHQQDPAPAEGAILKRAWFRWYKTPRDGNGDPLPPAQIVTALGITLLVQAADTALTEKTTSDYTADVALGQAPNRIYVLDLLKEKMEAPAMKAALIAFHAKWNANALVIEGGSSASGKATAQGIKAETLLPVIELPVMSDKVVGVNTIAPSVEAGLIYLPEDQTWAHDLLESLVTFPAGLHDDDVDAFRIGVWYLLFGGGGRGMLDWIRQQAEASAGTTAAAA